MPANSDFAQSLATLTQARDQIVKHFASGAPGASPGGVAAGAQQLAAAQTRLASLKAERAAAIASYDARISIAARDVATLQPSGDPPIASGSPAPDKAATDAGVTDAAAVGAAAADVVSAAATETAATAATTIDAAVAVGKPTTKAAAAVKASKEP